MVATLKPGEPWRAVTSQALHASASATTTSAPLWNALLYDTGILSGRLRCSEGHITSVKAGEWRGERLFRCRLAQYGYAGAAYNAFGDDHPYRYDWRHDVLLPDGWRARLRVVTASRVAPCLPHLPLHCSYLVRCVSGR